MLALDLLQKLKQKKKGRRENMLQNKVKVW